MTHLEMLKEMLDGQNRRGLKTGEWERTEYELARSIFHGSTELKVESLKLIFLFNRVGRFVGIVNYKQ